MSNGIFIRDQEYTFQELMYLLARAISAITDENEEAVFSRSDEERLNLL